MKHAKFIIGIILMLVVVILMVQNHEPMSTEVVFRINFFSFQIQSATISLYYIVTIAFLFGVIISGLFGIMERFRLKKEIKTLKTASREKDKELNSLRNFPITSDDMSVETPTEINSDGKE